MSDGTPLPRLTPESSFFWTSGADGVLRLLRCTACERFAHPPTPDCRFCGGKVLPLPVSGRGTVWTWTTSHQKLLPELDVPYTLVVIALEEQDDVHLTSRLVGDPLDVEIGMPVQVRFEQHGDVHLPVFERATA